MITQKYRHDLFYEIYNWREQRNSVIHDFAKQDMDYSEIRKSAIEGQKLFRELLSSTQRFKKQYNKYKNNISES